MLSQLSLSLLALAGIVVASKPGLLFGRDTYSGVATFNNYAAQGNTVCGPKSGIRGTYGAAASTASQSISGGACFASIDPNQCAGQSPRPNYVGPGCPTSNCGFCYRVTNTGGYDGAGVGGVGNSIVVQIIDSCPAESAFNYCKTNVPADQRCGAGNGLDIDESAYEALTGRGFTGGVPNLYISITPVRCP